MPFFDIDRKEEFALTGELHCHSRFSDGTMSVDDLVFYAKKIGLGFLSITDHDTLAGVTRAAVVGRRYGVEVIGDAKFLAMMPGAPGRHTFCAICRKSRTACRACWGASWRAVKRPGWRWWNA